MKKRTIALLMAAVMLFGVAVGGTIAWMTDEADEVVNTFTTGDIQIKLDEADVNIQIPVKDESGNEVKDEDGETIYTYKYDEYVQNNGHVDSIEKADRVQKNEYKLIPGSTYSKDPKVTVLAKSEDCYVYVKVKEEHNELTNKDGEKEKIIEWEINSLNWLVIDSINGVYVYSEDGSAATIVEYSDNVQTLAPIIIYKETADSEPQNNIIKINENLTNDMMKATGFETPVLSFDAYAVQAANMSDEKDDNGNIIKAAEVAWKAAAFDVSGTTTAD